MWSRYFLGLFVALLFTFTPPSSAFALPGDLNASGMVDGTDLIAFGQANGTTDSDGSWNPDADLDDNGVVDQSDLTILSTHFAKSGLSFGLWLGDALAGDDRIAKISSRGNILLRRGSYVTPAAVAANIQDGSVWIADSDNGQRLVRKIDSSSGETLLTVLGVQATSLAVNSSDGSVWISDATNNQVLQLLPSITDGYDISTDAGQHLAVLGFSHPLGIAVNEDGIVWIADNYHNQIVRLDTTTPDGYDLAIDSGHHHLITGISRPEVIAVDQSDGTVWFSDTSTDNVIKYDKNGMTRILEFGGFTTIKALAVNFVDHSIWIADSGANEIIRLDANGAPILTATGFNSPVNLDVDPLTGVCWVLDNLNNQLVKLSPDGTELLRVDGFSAPVSLAVVPDYLDASKYPIAQGSVDANMVDSGATVTFSAVGTDPDGTIALYEWDFDGDGIFDYSSVTDDDTTTSYTVTGVYNAVLRVTDNEFLQASDYSNIIRVGQLQATATADVTTGTAPLRVYFDGSFFDPIDGQVDSYQWDFDGNGTFDYYSETTPSANHTYDKAGTYTASLKITDGPFVAIADDLIIVVTQTTPSVTASITPTSGTIPLVVSCTGSGSDPDGTVVLYQWDMDGDGNYDWHSTSSGNRTYTYTESGNFQASLRLTDNDGNIVEKAILVTPGATPPVVEVGADVTSGYGPLSVNFNGDGSHDPDGTIVKYEWNFEGECSDTTTFSDDMESGDGDWLAESPWARVTSDAHGGSSSWTDSPGGDYQNNQNISLNLATSGHSAWTGNLSFWHRHQFSSYDYGYLEISVDGGTNWERLDYYYNNQEAWAVETYNLDQYLPAEDLRFQFRMYSNGTTTNDGWYIDDVVVEQCLLQFTTSTDGTANHSYATPGTYIATLRLTDDEGNVSTRQITITVLAGDVPSATVSSDVSIGYTTLPVSFTGSAQYPDGSITEYQWNYGEEFVWVIDNVTDELLRLAQDGSGVLVRHSFANLTGLVVDPSDGTVWASDRSRNQLIHLSADGETELHAIDGFSYPLSPTINTVDSSLWLSDYYHNQVVHIDSQGRELKRVSGFYYPRFVAVNSADSSVWIVNGSSGHPIIKLSEDGVELARVVGFSYPHSLAVNPGTNHVWVTDSSGDKVVRLDADIGGTYDISTDTGKHLVSTAAVDYPQGIDVNTTDSSVWIADYYHSQVVKIDQDGDEIVRIGGITRPQYIAVNSMEGSVWCVTPYSNEVIKLAADGTELSRIVDLTDPAMIAFGVRPGNTHSSNTTGNTSHSYSVPGLFYPVLTALSNDDKAASAGLVIHVSEVPSVNISADYADGPAAHEVFFTVSGEDRDGKIVKYEWDYDTNGVIDETINETALTARHIYPVAGSYTATLTVTDDDGDTAQDSMVINVTARPPTVTAYAKPAEGNAALAVIFSATVNDDDGTIDLYEWDFDGDGTYDTSSTSSADASHSYTASDEYTAILRVTDNDTLQAISSVNIIVHPTGTPTALLSAEPTYGLTPLTVNFCINGQDTDGSISSYEMDFEGDGTFDASYASAPTAFYDEMENGSSNWSVDSPWEITFESAFSGVGSFSDSPDGDYANDADVSLSTVAINLSAAQSPVLTFRHHYNFLYGDYGRVEISVNGGVNWSTLGSYSNSTVNEWSLVQYDLYSYRGNADVRIRFRVSSNSADTGDGWYVDDVLVGDCTVQHNYSTDGVFNATLRVTDNEGKQDSSIIPVTVVAAENTSYVWGADRYHSQIVKLSDQGETLARISGFYYPRAAAVDPVTGDVWVTDTNRDQMVKLDADVQDGYSIALTNIADTVPTGRAGKVNGDIAVTAGQIAGAMHFDGSGDYITTPNNSSHRTDNWTMEAWVKPASFDGINTILGKVSQVKDYALVLSGDQLGVLVYDAGRKYLLNPTVAAIGTWYHVAATFAADTNTLNLYVDGSLVNTSTDWTPNMSNTDTFNIGKSNCCNEYFNGDIDDVRFWGVPRSQADIAGGRNSALGGNEQGLIFNYSLDAFADYHQIVAGFNDPYYAVVDATDSSVWVADYYNNQIVKLAADGTELHRLDGFSRPRRLDMCQTDQSVWLTDNSHDQVVQLDTNGVELVRLGGFNDSIGISVDQSDCSVWVADYYNNQVVKLNPSGVEVLRLGGFNRPVAVAVDSSDHTVWVSDYENDQVVKLSSEGAELQRISNFNSPHDIKVNQKDGTVWIADLSNNSLVKIAPDGSWLFRVNGFSSPTSLGIDDGRRFLSDPPVASGSVTPQSGIAPLAVTFNDSASTDNSAIVRYEWDFDGDTVFDYSSATSGSTSFSYETPGTYYPALRVTDDQGLVDYDQSNILYVTPLTVTLHADPVTGEAPHDVAFFSVVTGLLPDQTVSRYEWDFDGDGVFDVSSTNSPQIVHEYSRPGSFTATVKISDGDGNSAFASLDIIVAEGPPTVTGYATPTSGSLPLLVHLTGSARDPDGSIVLYEWDYDGDGSYDWFSQNSADTYFTYRTVGTYAVTLRVTDNDGGTAVYSRTVTVSDSALPPVVTASADPVKIYVNAGAITFSGSAQDPDDGIINLYEWDFDGDGVFEYSSTDTIDITHTYLQAGQYSATLRVTDIDTLTTSATVSVTILATGAPTAEIQTSPSFGVAPLTVEFDGSNSSDPDGDIVQYQWGFGAQQLFVSDSSNNRLKSFVGGNLTGSYTGVSNPIFMVVDEANNAVWTSNYNGHDVVKMSADGVELARSPGFYYPHGIALNQTDFSVWVSDYYHHQVVHLDENGVELARIDGFYRPVGIAVDQTDQSVWVADYYNNQVARLDSSGVETGRFSGFNRPYSVTADPGSRTFLISDSSNNQIVRLGHDTPDGYIISTSKVTADTTGSVEGLVIGDGDIAATGRLNGALSFNDASNPYVLLLNNPALDVQSFTFETWGRSSDVSRKALFMRGDSGGSNEILIWYYTNTRIDVLLNNTTYSFDGGVDFTDGIWHHIAVVHDAESDTLNCYVDGAQYGATLTPAVELDFGGSNALIGADFDSFNSGLGNYYKGDLDDVRFWNIARTAAEITADYSSELTGSETGLVGYWPMNSVTDTPYHTLRAGFSDPRCVEVDPYDKSVVVCDYGNSQMVKLSPELDREIFRKDGFYRPFDAVVSPSDSSIWVADKDHHQVVQLSRDGAELQRLSGFYYPHAVGLLASTTNTTTESDDSPVLYTYTLDGTYQSSLTVVDNDGLSDRTSSTIHIGGPKSIPLVYPVTGKAPLDVRFSANGSCTSCTLVLFAYDYDGNGVADWSTTISETNSYTYRNPGTYIVSQEVTGNNGLTHTESVTVTVLPADDQLVAEAIAEPQEGVAPLFVDFTGLGSAAASSIVKYEWDFESDGNIDYSSTTSGRTSHSYSSLGIYNALFRVTDSEANTASSTVVIQVKETGSPIANATADPVSGVTPLEVNFTATAEDDGEITLYEWDFDGDGVYDWNSTTLGNVVHDYTGSGSFEATLRVTDDTGKQDTATVTIQPSMHLTASLSHDILDPTNQETVSINSVLTGDADVTLKITDRNGGLIRTLINNEGRIAGYYSDAWDGKDDGGTPVTSGIYLFIIEYTVDGVSHVYDLTNNANPARKTPPVVYPASFNPLSSETNFFRYTLAHKGEITIYISYFSGGAGERVKTLLLRYPQPAGNYVQVWDGTDDQGNLVNATTYVIAVFSWDLPENGIIIRQEPVISDLSVVPTYLNPAALPYDESNTAEFSFTLSKVAHVQAVFIDEHGYNIRTLQINNVPAGVDNSFVWDGKNSSGSLVSPGTYRVKVIATDANGAVSLPANALLVVFY